MFRRNSLFCSLTPPPARRTHSACLSQGLEGRHPSSAATAAFHSSSLSFLVAFPAFSVVYSETLFYLPSPPRFSSSCGCTYATTPPVIPYPGELYILNKLLDAIIDVNGEQSVEDHQKLFMVGCACVPPHSAPTRIFREKHGLRPHARFMCLKYLDTFYCPSFVGSARCLSSGRLSSCRVYRRPV